MKEHVLKTDPEIFEQSWEMKKNWEIRFNDRDYQIGDIVVLRETVHTGLDMKMGAKLIYTGRKIEATIAYIMHGPQYGLAERWVIMSLSDMSFSD